MGKKGSQNKGQNGSNRPQSSMTLREESLGKKQTNVNAKSLLKVQHVKNLATWASVEASIPSLGAFFGHCLAESTEALGISADPSLFTCQRCESILHPGSNCTVRIESNKAKVHHRRKKSKAALQNNVVYKCHFCLHSNLLKGTRRGHLKEFYPPKNKHPKSECAKSKLTKPPISERVDLEDAVYTENCEATTVRDSKETAEVSMSDVPKDDTNNPATPLVKEGMTLLEARSKKRSRSKSKKPTESPNCSTVIESRETVSASNKRKKKSWTSLKEIAESSENANRRNLTDLPIPFFI